MRVFLLLILAVLIVSFHQVSLGQTRDPASTPTPRPLPNFQTIIQDARRDQVRPGEPRARRARNDRAEAYRRAKAEMEPEEGVAAEFSGLRKSLEAELVRLHPDFDCEAKFELSVVGNCAGRVLGASKFEALHYNHDKLAGDAFFSIVMIADLGQVGFERVDAGNDLVRLLTEMELPTDLSATKTLYEKLSSTGFTSGGLHLTNKIEALEGKTFVVRIVQYKAAGLDTWWQGPGRLSVPFEFYALDRPGRHDKTYSAKVVRRSDDGVIHLLWREISKKKPPKIRFAKDEAPTDFRTKKD
jgi:hypothetical protein